MEEPWAQRREYQRHQPSMATDGHRNGRSLGAMLRELAVQTQSLVHLEVQLAKTEISEKLSAAGKHAGLLAGGGMVAYAGLIGIVMALGFLLGSFMANWLGFLIAGALFAAVGGMVLKKGLDGLQETQFALEKTAESIEEDKEWIRGETSDVKKDPAHLGSHR